MNTNKKCGYAFSWLEQQEHFGTKIVWLCWMFCFTHLPPTFPCSNREESFVKLFGDCVWEQNRSLMFRVDRKSQPSASLVSHWNGGPSWWDFPVPLNTNYGFCLSILWLLPFVHVWDKNASLCKQVLAQRTWSNCMSLQYSLPQNGDTPVYCPVSRHVLTASPLNMVYPTLQE